MSVELSPLAAGFTSAGRAERPYSLPEGSPSGAGTRASTLASRREAVEQVILTMQERLHEPLPLQTMAEVALLSPYHFNRVFRLITGITPCRFLTVLRMEAAKRLLLSTRLSVSDICFEVGFRSQGSFTRDFTQFVGVSPNRLRRLGARSDSHVSSSLRHGGGVDLLHVSPSAAGITGRITGPESFQGLIFIGLFTTPFPQGRPESCALLTRPNTTYSVAQPPDGCYHVFAAAFDRPKDLLAYLMPDHDTLWVGTTTSPLLVREGRAAGPSDVKLRPMRLTDPPILVALPVLIAEQSARRRGARDDDTWVVCPS
jgi:AraC family transcriptional regulator